ncbi:MAG: TonB family protein [Myxococcales bacterium]
MIPDRRLIICAVLSIFGHLAFATGLGHLPKHEEPRDKRIVSLRVIESPPPPELAPAVEPPKARELTAPKAAPQARVRARTPALVPSVTPPKDLPPVDRPAAASDPAEAAPIFGVTMQSTSQAGSGPEMRVGGGGPRQGPAAPESDQRPAGTTLGEPVPAYDVTVMPLPQGRCAGKYTDEAKQAAVEGTVVLDLVVGADGRARDIHVVSGLAHGLTQAAIDALKSCRFTPGEKSGVPVAVRLRGFKIRFVMQDNE